MYTFNDIIKAKLLRKRRIDENNCWIYTGHIDKKGYGRIGYGESGKDRLVHRVSAEFWLPNYKSELLVCHKCDNPPCFNPEHLFQGTHLDNATDRHNKGGYKNNRTHCINGHELNEENILIICRICKNLKRRKTE